MLAGLRTRVIATVCYGDIFDHPRTRQEVSLWLVGGGTKVPRSISGLEYLRRQGNTYLILPGRNKTIALRHERKEYARRKWRVASHITRALGFLPTLLLVGATGGLAVDNARDSDDIDLFFITRKGTLWISRALVVLLVELFGRRRRPGETVVRDAICLNMFVDEDHLRVPTQERDLFSAHEVLQMKPLWAREAAYLRFLRANRWVKEFLPNAWAERMHDATINIQNDNEKRKNGFLFRLFVVIVRVALYVFDCLEPVSRAFQLWYMRKRRTKEVIGAGAVRFHPVDARTWVKGELAVRLDRFNIPLDKTFYRR